MPDASSGTEGGPPARVALATHEERPTPVDLAVRVGSRLPMPDAIVSRLWIRTVQRPENDLATSARFWVETRDGVLKLALPTGSNLVKARVGGSELADGDIELLASDQYRIKLPGPSSSVPVLVTLDFVVPAALTSPGWPTIRLLGDGVVQQTFWEALVPGSRAGVGTPAGWTDENDWFWTGTLWKRRPSRSPAELSNWLTGGNGRYRLGEILEAGESSSQQTYLFSRVGPPTPLRFAVLSRITLLLLCSGPVLGVGLLILARRPPPRLIAASLLILGFAAGSLIEPDVLILVGQSSVLGFGLWLSALAMSWAIERAGHSSRPTGEGAVILPPSSTGSSMARPSPVTSDESTAIRVRPKAPSAVSTADHVVLLRSPKYHSDDDPHPDPDHS